MGCEQATQALSKAERSAEEIAQIQSELNHKASEVHHLHATLDLKEREIRVRPPLVDSLAPSLY